MPTRLYIVGMRAWVVTMTIMLSFAACRVPGGPGPTEPGPGPGGAGGFGGLAMKPMACAGGGSAALR
jgi:hypothetical protein